MTYVLYHANCPDGFWAAYAAWRQFRNDARYIPVTYNEDPPTMEPGSKVYIVDFSYKRDVLFKLREQHLVTIIDHHKTALEDLKDLPNVHFDLQHSGCVLTWDYFHNPKDRPLYLDYIEDRDLWKWQLSDSREVNAGLSIEDNTFERLDFIVNSVPIEVVKMQGSVVLKTKKIYLNRLMSNIFTKQVGGFEVPVINSSIMQSELGDALCEQYPFYPFAAIYYDGKHNKRYWSLRSRGAFDVSEVAKRLGGGGHPNAAGFTEQITLEDT